MKYALFFLLAFTPLIDASEQTSKTFEQQAPSQEYTLDAFPPEIKAALIAAAAQKKTFHEAVSDVKNLRAVSRSFAQLIDTYYMTDQLIGYFAQTYKQDPAVAALYLGTPQAQTWLQLHLTGGTVNGKKVAADKAMRKRVEYLYNNLISGGIKLENLDTKQVIASLQKMLPKRSKQKLYAALQESVKKKNISALRHVIDYGLDLNYSKDKTSPELHTLLRSLDSIAKELFQIHLYLNSEEFMSKKDSEQMLRNLQAQVAQTREAIRLLVTNGAQMSSLLTPTFKRLIQVKALTSDDVTLFQKTQRVLQKSKK